MYNFNSGAELVQLCHKHKKKIWEIMFIREIENSEHTYDEIYNEMLENLRTMFASVEKGLNTPGKSISGLVGGDAQKLNEYLENKHTYSGKETLRAVAGAMAVVEVNASMGLIVAAPTAGSSGILPGVLHSIKLEKDPDENTFVQALFTAAAIGLIIAKNATVAGAEGGCQAETGTAAAMTAAAIVEMENGTPEQALNAAAITIKNVLGLVCDPIAGLVECPCVKRNALGAANALISADMALAGITSIIPFDEVVDTMSRVGRAMSPNLKETALGGLAITPTGKKLATKILKSNSFK